MLNTIYTIKDYPNEPIDKQITEINRDKKKYQSLVNRNGGRDYRGTLNTTMYGNKCQNWSSQWPHKHTRTPSRFSHHGIGNHNYCRNPDGEPRLWCYTTNNRRRWEFCSPKTAYQMYETDAKNLISKIKNEEEEKNRLANIEIENKRIREKQEQIRKIKEEEERKRLAEERRINEIRDEKHNKHWNTIGKAEKRTFECNDVNGNRIGGKNLYLDDSGILFANEKSIALSIDQMSEIIKTRQLSNSKSNPKWMKMSSSNFLYPYDPHNNKGDKIEYDRNSLVSSNNIFKLEMTKEGNLVLKKTIQGCITNYTKKENIGDYKAFKSNVNPLMNNYVLVDNSKKVLKPISNNIMEYDDTYKYIGSFIPEHDNNRTLVQNKEECFKKCNEDNNCGHVYYIESETGDNYCIHDSGNPVKFIPIQPNKNIKKSSLYIRNKKMKSIQSDKNISKKDLYILEDPNKRLPSQKVTHVSNYSAYSDYEINNTPITQYQELLGSDVEMLKEQQTKLFEGFKESDERSEEEPVKPWIINNQIQPLAEIEHEYTQKMDKISDNYDKLEKEINDITNKDETGLRDKLMNDKKYKKSFLSVELEKSKDVSDVRIDDTKAMIEQNNSIFNLGILTASTLLVAGIVVARE